MSADPEVLHRIHGAIDVARQMVTRSAALCDHSVATGGAEIQTALADAQLALNVVVGSLERALAERDQPAA